MSARHYDVVVLGRSLGALATAALLARRDFRVLLLGQGQKPPAYRFEGYLLQRRAFTLLFGASPIWRRILHELAQTQAFRRHIEPLDPMFVVLSKDFRMEVPPDSRQFGREIDREFPEVRQVVDELYSTFAQVNAAVDAAFERDAVWPPGRLWERLETGRVATALPLTDASDTEALLGKFPAGHAYRDLALLPALFATDLATAAALPPLALARLHGAWIRGVLSLDGAESELEQFLIERIVAHGGICDLDGHADSLIVRRGVCLGVREDGKDDPTGADAVVSALSGEAVADLAGGEGITKSARQKWPRLSATVGRFTLCLVVDDKGLPEPLAAEAFILPRRSARPDPRRPALRVQRRPAVADAEGAQSAQGQSLLTVEALVPRRGPLTLLEARQATLEALFEHLPFLERHVRLVDSPHDGLPVYDYRSGERREVERIHVPEATSGPEPMNWLWSVEPPGYLGLAGEPVRGPIPGTYLVGRTVLPALGQEGELLAAWSAARLITRKDRTRQKMRREMWNKVET